MISLFDLYKQSKVNRFHFLEKKKQEFSNCQSIHKRKKIIVELIQLEPSHLEEAWILDQVIKMMKDRQNNLDYIQEAFIAKGRRSELTETQRTNLAKTSFLSHKIDGISKRKEIHKIQAATRFLADLPEGDDAQVKQPAEALLQKIKRYKQSLDRRELPFPYYGLDFLECDQGTENQRVEFYVFGKPITNGEGLAVFGNTTISIPAKGTSKMFIPHSA